MSYLAVVTFDLVNAESEDYECIDGKFAKIGLTRSMKADNGNTVDLPFNTYAGKFEGTSAGQVRDYVTNQAELAMKSCSVKGKLFVAVGGDWAWGSRTV